MQSRTFSPTHQPTRSASPSLRLRTAPVVQAPAPRLYARHDGFDVIDNGRRTLDPALLQAHDELRQHVLSEEFPCVGARSAFLCDNYRFGLFAELGSSRCAADIGSALACFRREFPEPGSKPVSYVALFEGPRFGDEAAFEATLWRQLQSVHDADASAWAPQVDFEPTSADFSYSVGGRAFFVVGLHPGASRLARRTPRPTLVFNFHEQFETLRAKGVYDSMKTVIRRRDVALQGSVNPTMARFGDSSEARQYSGRNVGDDWQCPFRPRRGRVR